MKKKIKEETYTDGWYRMMAKTTTREQQTIGDLSPEELALCLIYRFGGVVPGALYMQKLGFLIAYEGKPGDKLQIKLEYHPYNLGPYSIKLVEALDKISRQRKVYIKEQVTDKYNKEIYFLTNEGRCDAQRIMDSLDSHSKEYLNNICDGAKQLGYNGILRYIYTRYPKFATKSKIKKDVYASFNY